MKRILMAMVLCLVCTLGFGQFYGPCPGNETVTDVEGNVYNTIQIGNTCWMKENLKSRLDTNYTVINNYNYVSNYDDNDAVFYGHSVSGIYNLANSLCPIGWKLPSSSDFIDLYYTMLNDGIINEYHFLEVLCDQSFIKDTLTGNNLSGFGLKPFTYYNSGSYTPQYNNFYLWFMNDGVLGRCSLNLSVGFHGLYMTTHLSGSSDITWSNIRCIKDTSHTHEVTQPDTIYIHDTLWLHDTIYIHDTITVADTIYIQDGNVGIQEWCKSIKVFPNPTTSTITLENIEGCSMVVHDMVGHEMVKIQRTRYQEVIDVWNWPAGVYLVGITKGTTKYMVKFIKQ